ncbi:hypothetical protein ACHAW5_005115 [Stephanodiscus triporus]|uniref:Indole-3-glycerol-phosphate synthase n=1 Tax=Stephanodiscus triporus TaxID=2934178 RepID=A0ABD3PIC2_9STRA
MGFATRHLGSDGSYYDSQSGRHVPFHDERKINAYLRSSIEDLEIEAAILHSMDSAKALGVAGSVLTLPQRQRPRQDGDAGIELRLLEALSNISEPASVDENAGTFFIRLPISHRFSSAQLRRTPANVNFCFEYMGEVTSITPFANGSKTSIGIFHPKYYIDVDPISVASEVANLIDETGSISYIVLDPTAQLPAETQSYTVCDDEMVRLCEELSYLDVVGPTIKSRLVVTGRNPDHIEECLSIGISKYIVDDVNCLEILGDVVDDAGKELVLNVIK